MTNSFLALFLMGFIPALIKLTKASVVTVGLVRLLIAVSLYWLYTQRLHKKIQYTKANIVPCMSMGLCFGFHWLCYFLSIRLSTVAVASFCMATNGIFMLVLSRYFFQEHLSKKDGLALLLTFAGSFLVMPSFDWGDRALQGFAIGLLNAFLFSITALLQKKYATQIPNHTRTFSQYAFALPIFCLLWPETTWALNSRDWLILGILGVLCTVIAHTLWIKSIESLPAKTTAILYYLSTVFAIVIGALFLGEIPAPRVLAGGALIIMGSAMAVLARRSATSEMAAVE